MMNRPAILLLGIVMAASANAQEPPRVYDLGPMTEVSTVKVEPGQLRDYMAYLNGAWRRGMEDSKRRGEVLNYAIMEPMDGREAEGNLVLVVTYRNAALLDTPLDVLDQRAVALQGSISNAQAATISHAKMRTILGTRIYRELTFRGPPSR